ncbi:MerR family transcriptional regulator [Eisenbergiella porci]|uniref:MerR family transcriptional regulator n=1 Tax=Eisenbergiella porci TaxID=2652274 RepID=UPI002A816BDB|nr:MerR family transcriptional regulator [Eisenbergiella porci]
MKNLFTIGEMGGLFRTNIRTLRYYDDIGLLRPEAVDPKTGYRYYSARQFERMNTIKYLRTLNMPLDKIKAFFENRDTLVMEQILEEQLQETRAQLARLQAIERKLATRLEQLDYAMHAQLDQIQEKHLPARPAAVLKKEIRQGENLEYPIRELERTSQLPPAMFLGKVGVSIRRENLLAGQFDRFSAIFVLIEEEDNYKGETAWLPEGDFLTIWYAGTHQDSAAYYKKLLAHMDTLGLECCGDSVEITWIDSGFTDDTEKYVTELQLPVRAKAPRL